MGEKGGLHEAAEMWDYLLTFETKSHCITQTGLELIIFSLWSSKGWDFRKELQCVTEIQGFHSSYHTDGIWKNLQAVFPRLSVLLIHLTSYSIVCQGSWLHLPLSEWRNLAPLSNHVAWTHSPFPSDFDCDCGVANCLSSCLNLPEMNDNHLEL